MDLNHRTAEPEDIHALARLMTAEDVLNLWPGENPQIDIVKALGEAHQHEALSVVEINGRLVAMYRNWLWYLAVWVRSEDRRAGIGSAIVRHVISQEEEPAFVVNIRADNSLARRFWTNLSFVEAKRSDENGVAMIEARYDPTGFLAQIDQVFGPN